MTAYNVGEYISKGIQSVIDQSFEDWELIVVNDCSTDNTLKVAQGFIDERIKIVNNTENVGAGMARQIGIDNAQGEFTFFLDGDDWLNPMCLEKLYEAATVQNADIVNCRVEHINDIHTPSITTDGTVRERMFTFFPNKLIRRSLWEKTHYSPLRLYEDINTLYRLLHFSNKTIRINYAGYVYNLRPNSLTTTKDEQTYLKWTVYQALSIMENVDFFEGINHKYKEMYSPKKVFELYDSIIKKAPMKDQAYFIDEIEEIRLWCETQIEKVKSFFIRKK